MPDSVPCQKKECSTIIPACTVAIQNFSAGPAARMNSRTISLDIAILGGGIAGLWLLSRLSDAGYTVALFERSRLGDGQTAVSQGMIHSGTKYGVEGWRRPAAALAAMPARWRACVEGRGEIDLRGAIVLSDEVLFWAGSGLPARLVAAAAVRLLQGQAELVPKDEYPVLFREQFFRGAIYRFDDWVLDVPSVVAILRERWRARIFKLDAEDSLERDASGRAVLKIGKGSSAFTLQPRLCLLTAGIGNSALLAALGAKQPTMRRRPLCQLLVTAPGLPRLFGHSLGFSTMPPLTVSSHSLRDGSTAWYLGGRVAERGAALYDWAVLSLALRELRGTFPRIDWRAAKWAIMRVDRAEPVLPPSQRAKGPFVQPVPGCANAVVAWPQKLSLAPALGDAVLNILQQQRLEPGGSPADFAPLAVLATPDVAVPPWQE